MLAAKAELDWFRAKDGVIVARVSAALIGLAAARLLIGNKVQKAVVVKAVLKVTVKSVPVVGPVPVISCTAPALSRLFDSKVTVGPVPAPDPAAIDGIPPTVLLKMPGGYRATW